MYPACPNSRGASLTNSSTNPRNPWRPGRHGFLVSIVGVALLLVAAALNACYLPAPKR